MHETRGFNLAQQENWQDAQRELALAVKEAGSNSLGAEYEALSMMDLADLCQAQKQFDAAQAMYEKAAQLYQNLAAKDAASGWARQLEAAYAWARMANCLLAQQKVELADKHYQKSIYLVSTTKSDSPERTRLVEADLNSAYTAFLEKTGRVWKKSAGSVPGKLPEQNSVNSTADNAITSGAQSEFKQKIDKIHAAISDNKSAEARQLLSAAVKESELKGSGDPDVAANLLPLGEVCVELKDFVHAEKLFKQYLTLRGADAGNDSVDLIPGLTALGNLYDIERKGVETVETFQKVRALQVKEGSEKGWLANSDWRIAEGYIAQGNSKQAYEHLIRAFSELNDDQIGGDMETNMLYEMAEVCAIIDHDEEADQSVLKALKNIEKEHGKDSAKAANTLLAIAEVCKKEGKLAFAEKQLLRSLDTFRRRVTLKDADAFTAWKNLLGVGNSYLRKGDSDQAIRVFKSALALCETDLGPEAQANMQPLNLLGRAYAQQNKLPESIAVLRRSLQIGNRNAGTPKGSSMALAGTCSVLAQSLMRAGKPDEARPLFERTLAMLSGFNGKVFPWMINDCESSAQLLKGTDAQLSQKLSSLAQKLKKRQGV